MRLLGKIQLSCVYLASLLTWLTIIWLLYLLIPLLYDYCPTIIPFYCKPTLLLDKLPLLDYLLLDYSTTCFTKYSKETGLAVLESIYAKTDTFCNVCLHAYRLSLFTASNIILVLIHIHFSQGLFIEEHPMYNWA